MFFIKNNECFLLKMKTMKKTKLPLRKQNNGMYFKENHIFYLLYFYKIQFLTSLYDNEYSW